MIERATEREGRRYERHYSERDGSSSSEYRSQETDNDRRTVTIQDQNQTSRREVQRMNNLIIQFSDNSQEDDVIRGQMKRVVVDDERKPSVSLNTGAQHTASTPDYGMQR